MCWIYTKFVLLKCVCSYPCTLQSLTLHVEIFLMFFLFVPFQFFIRPQKFCGCIMFWRCHRPSVDGMFSMRYLMLYLTDPSEFWTHMDLWYCNPTLSQTRGKIGCFCYLHMESLFFIWFWSGFFKINSLGIFLSEKDA